MERLLAKNSISFIDMGYLCLFLLFEMLTSGLLFVFHLFANFVLLFTGWGLAESLRLFYLYDL